MTRALAAWAVTFVLALYFVPIARAQGSGGSPPTTVLLDLGFGSELPAGQWAPARVVVSPMDNAVEAVARIVIRTPANDSLSTLVHVDTTPNKETIVPTTLWVPPSIASITVDLIQSGGRRIASTAYGAVAGAQAIKLEPPTQMPIILGVSSPSLRLAFGNENYEREFVGPLEEQLRNRVAVAKVASAMPQRIGEAPWLPSVPMAYQGLAATVIDGQLALGLEPGGLRALRESLIAGGRVMVVNADNQSLRAILDEYLPTDLSVEHGRPTTLPVTLGGPGQIVSRSFDQDSLPAGWKIVPQSEGLAAEGPVGLGWVMALGFDPDELADAGLVSATETAWHGTLATMIGEDLDRGTRALGTNQWENQPLLSVAATNALNWVSRAPSVGLGAFLAIFAMMVGLAIAIGPIDRFVLKRLRALHRWWLAALAWIFLATIGAWILPPKVRSGPTSVSSVRVVDAWQSVDGPARAWQTSVDGMFMNTSATIGLDDIDEGSWLSPMFDPWRRTSLGSLNMAPTGSVMKPAPTTARLWTVRTFGQQGATAATIRASIEVNDDRYSLRLTGATTDDLELAAVRTSGRWLHLFPGAPPRRTGQTVEFTATRGDLNLYAPRPFNPEWVNDDRFQYMYPRYGDGPREPEPALMLHLDGADARGPALEALSNTDQWAVIYLKWRNEQPLIGSDVGETFSTLWVYRLAVPIATTGAPQ